MAMTKIKGLQMWCRKMTEGYPSVDIANFTTAWRDGLAFCAIIHRFRPDLIDFDSLSHENVFENCKLAFELAERELNIPAFLEAEDMVRLKVPDKLSIITYVSQYYNFLHALPQLGGPGVKSKVFNKTASGTKRPTDSDNSQAPITKKPSTTEMKENSAPATDKSTLPGDKCGICQKHVFLLERLMEDGKLYHRSCFRHSELSPANKAYTRSPFLSPSLSSETQSFTTSNTDNKSSVISKVGISNTNISSNKQMEVGTAKADSEVLSVSKKAEGVGSKHSLNEQGREDVKKSKLQPKALFSDEKFKNESAVNDKLDNLLIENSKNKSSESEKSFPHSSKTPQNVGMRQKEILTSETSRQELNKSTQRNMPLIFQQKNISTLAISSTVTETVATTTAVTVTMQAPSATRNTSETRNISTFGVVTSNTVLPPHTDPKSGLSQYNLKSGKDGQKHSDEKKLESVSSKTKALPSVQNLQKMFSDKPNSDISESPKTPYPVARPRSGTLKSASEESSSNAAPTIPAIRASAEEKNKDMTPKPAPRKNVLEVSEPSTVSLKQQKNDKLTVNTDSRSDELKTSRSFTADLPPSLPKSAPPPLPSFNPSGEIISTPAEKKIKKTADKLLQETKTSINPAKHIEDPRSTSVTNTPHNLYQKIDSSKIATPDNSKLKPAGSGNNVHSSNQTNSKTRTDTEQNNLSVPAKKEGDNITLSGLLTSLKGVRSQLTSDQGPTNDISQTHTKISHSNVTLKTDIPPSSESPVNKTIVVTSIITTSSQTGSTVFTKPKIDSTKSHVNHGIHTKSNSEQSIVPQSHKNAPSSVKINTGTPNKQNTPNRAKESLVTISTVKPASDATAIIQSSKPEPNKFEKITNGFSKSAPFHTVDVHNKEKITIKLPGQNLNQNSDVKSTGNSQFNLKYDANTSESKTDLKHDTSYSAPTNKDFQTVDSAKSLSSIKNKSLSSSKEDLRNINSIKLAPTNKDFQTVDSAKSLSSIKNKSLSSSKEDLLDINNIKLAPTNKDFQIVDSAKSLSSIKNKSLSSSKEDLRNINSIKLAPTNKDLQTVDSAKSLSSIKNKSLSSSKEDLLDINNIKLRTVMPERKETQEPKVLAYDVKLKKVDVIKGDTKWDSIPQNTLNSQSAAETKDADKNSGFDESVIGNQKEGPPSGKEMIHKSSLLTTKDSQSEAKKNGITSELPQWKKDIEERKKKFANQSESEGGQSTSIKIINDKDAHKADISDKKLNKVSKENTNITQKASEVTLTLPKKLIENVSLEKDSVKNVGTSRIVDKLRPSNESQRNANKLDWQLEAEKRMAALAGFDSTVIVKLKDGDKLGSSDIKLNQDKKNSVSHRAEDLTRISDKTNDKIRKNNGDKIINGDSAGQSKDTNRKVLDKNTAKFKESELEFVLKKTTFKPVEVDINTALEEAFQELDNDNGQKTLSKTGKGDDFRDVLHQLKRITPLDCVKTDSVKTEKEIGLQSDTTKSVIPPPSVTIPSLNNNMNKNNNRLPISEENHIPDAQSIHHLKKSEPIPMKTVSEGSTDENGNERKNHTSQPPEVKPVFEKVSKTAEEENGIAHLSPKVKRKIPILDSENKDMTISQPSSPTHKKKIPVPKFDFEKSSDFEQSLTESTAKLTIQETSVTPVRPPRSHSIPELKSPNHISAIELQKQLQTIDTKLTGLELRGRELEESIRTVNSLEDDDDNLMIEWFSLINEKNDLVRKEADLIYLSREQELETEQEQIESQLRYLLSKPDECKSPEEKQEEDYLIQHKINLVEQRNKIVNSMDEDRIRYKDEDRGIEVILKDKGYWKDSTGTLKALKGKKVAKSVFYA